jgi:hypothetical protein
MGIRGISPTSNTGTLFPDGYESRPGMGMSADLVWVRVRTWYAWHQPDTPILAFRIGPGLNGML